MGHSEINHTTTRCGEEARLSRRHDRLRNKWRTCHVLATVALLAASSPSCVHGLANVKRNKESSVPLWQTNDVEVEVEVRRRRRPGLRPRPVPPPLSLLRLTALEDEEDDEHVRRKLKFAARYTDVDTLRRTFGTNRNKLWGDFDAETTRRLYHVLLPRAMLELYRIEGQLRPQELAPLAYEARVAAKKYARERCVVPGRLFSMAFDGFRSWKNYGTWNAEGLSWEQIWQKYENEVLSENLLEDDKHALTHKVCLKILEKACASNPLVDKMFLSERTDPFAEPDVARIAQILDQETQQLLNPSDEHTNHTATEQSHHLRTSDTHRIFHLTPQTVATLRFIIQTKKQLIPQRPTVAKIRCPSVQILPQRHRNQRVS